MGEGGGGRGVAGAGDKTGVSGSVSKLPPGVQGSSTSSAAGGDKPCRSTSSGSLSDREPVGVGGLRFPESSSNSFV